MNEDKEVTDTNVGNIKEDVNEIEKIKNLLRFLKVHGWIPDISKTIDIDKTIKAIERILQDYTRQKQINEEYQKINEELREKVKESENYINPSKARISYFDTKKGANVVIEGFIPKQKIKDKIEELKYRADRIAGTYQYADSQEHLQEKKNKVIELRTKAMALEELLKEEDN